MIEIFRKHGRLLAFLVGAIVVVSLGQLYWGKKRDGLFRELYERKSFVLLDTKGELFKSSSLKPGEKALLLFPPDDPKQSHVNELYQFSKKIDFSAKKTTVLLVSRMHIDSLRNFSAYARWPGRVLQDPSGSVGRLTQAYPSLEPIPFWAYTLMDHEFRVLWTLQSDRLMSREELLKRIP